MKHFSKNKLNVLFYFVTLLVFFSSCSKETECDCIQFVSLLRVSLEDSQGKNLLNNEGFKVNEMIIYYKINGQKVVIQNGLLEYYDTITSKPNLNIHLNIEDDSQKTTTYLQWNKNDIDTIEASFIRTNGVILNDIWYNGRLIPKSEYNNGNFKVVK